MYISLEYQLVEAGFSILLGFALGMVYDLFRIMRRRFGLRRITPLLDALYWLLAAAALFFFAACLSQRGFRLFMFIFAVLGGGIYFNTLSASCMWILERFADLIIFFIRIALFPLKFLLILIKKIIEKLKKVFQYFKKWFTINDNRFVRPKASAVKARSTKEGRFETQENKHTDKADHSDYHGLRGGYSGGAEFKDSRGRGAKGIERSGKGKP